jgi:hypothetical protein
MLTPGDVADRLSILSIKLARARAPNAQLQDQFLEAQAVWHSYKIDAHKEYEALADVNHEAYDVVELIYADFRDPLYGTEKWDICADLDWQKNEKTIKNCRRAHELNMERVRLKNAINEKAGAKQEVKSW